MANLPRQRAAELAILRSVSGRIQYVDFRQYPIRTTCQIPFNRAGTVVTPRQSPLGRAIRASGSGERAFSTMSRHSQVSRRVSRPPISPRLRGLKRILPLLRRVPK